MFANPKNRSSRNATRYELETSRSRRMSARTTRPRGTLGLELEAARAAGEVVVTVGGEEEGEVGTAVERPPEALAGIRVERAGGLVEHERGRLADERGRSRAAAPSRSSNSRRAGRRTRRARALDETVRRLSRLTLVLEPQPAEEVQVLAARQADRRRALVTATRRRANWRPASPPGGLRSRRPSSSARASRRRSGRIVSGPVRAAERQALAALDDEVDPVAQDVLVAEAARERVGTNHRCSTLPRMGDSISLGRIAGIRIGINWSWLVVFTDHVVAFRRTCSQPELGSLQQHVSRDGDRRVVALLPVAAPTRARPRVRGAAKAWRSRDHAVAVRRRGEVPRQLSFRRR